MIILGQIETDNTSNQMSTITGGLGESRGLVVKAEDSQLSGCGFEPLRRILDGVSKVSYYIVKKK